MKIDLDRYRVPVGGPAGLGDRDPADTQGLSEDDDKKRVKKQTSKNVKAIDDLQERLYAESKQSLLVVLQAMDGAGKDSTTRHCFGDLNPQGVRVWSFKAPSDLELSHDFLWRVHARCPGQGYIGVFNRSHYEDVLIVKVHGWAPAELIEKRYDHINAFERLLADHGTRVLKLMIHISKGYQLGRMRRRLERQDKHWKFNPADLEERELWPKYMDAYETALSRCSTDAGPWYVIPGEQRWFRDLVVTQLIRQTLEDMDPQFPPPAFDPADYPPESIT